MRIPWWFKLVVKVVLSRLPFDYNLWRRVGLFRHGTMDTPSYALGVFRQHYDRVSFARKGDGFTALELGPGDAAVSGMIAAAHRARRCYLVDTADYATRRMDVYRATSACLEAQGLHNCCQDIVTFEDMLSQCNVSYLTDGLASLRQIPNASIDFVWSHAVLEHVRRSQFSEVMQELRRIIRIDGVCSHRVDLTDHLGGGLNNLRFPSNVWESDFFAKSGFYTNRLRFRQMLKLFEDAGFDVQIVKTLVWDTLPLPVTAMSMEFSGVPEEELAIYAFDVILTPVP